MSVLETMTRWCRRPPRSVGGRGDHGQGELVPSASVVPTDPGPGSRPSASSRLAGTPPAPASGWPFRVTCPDGAQLVAAINQLGNSMGVNLTATRDMFGWVGPVLTALQGSVACDLGRCPAVRPAPTLSRLAQARHDGGLAEINGPCRAGLQSIQDRQSLNAALKQVGSAFTRLTKVMKYDGFGIQPLPVPRRRWPSSSGGPNARPAAAVEVADGVGPDARSDKDDAHRPSTRPRPSC